MIRSSPYLENRLNPYYVIELRDETYKHHKIECFLNLSTTIAFRTAIVTLKNTAERFILKPFSFCFS